MRTPIALLASVALLTPTALVAAPAEAATAATITNCSKTKYGVEVRIRIRDEGRFSRIRVSHPRGEGNFKEPRVKRVSVAKGSEGYTPPPDPNGGPQVGGGGWLAPLGGDPTFRTRSNFDLVWATFKLRNGRSVQLTCHAR